ncbi:transcriptional repressor [bacterium]|nr:transcriptional repressor [bacterium]
MQRRQTRQRQIIRDELIAHPTHPTADELYMRVKAKLPRVSLGTVYRNLELLVEEGAARRIVVEDGPKRYDGNTEPHHHVQCVRCGATADVMGDATHSRTGSLPIREGWDIQAVSVLYKGLCPTCRAETG